MKFTSFASLLNGEPARIAFLSTFQFDPDYFEQQLLRRCSSLTKARRIVVFMDAREWTKLIRQGIHARLLNQRYLVVPVNRSTGVFHPKLSLLLTATGGQILCGSNNLTRSGCSSNLELLNSLPFEFDGDYEEEMLVASEAFSFFRRAVQDTDEEVGRFVSDWIKETAATFRWLDQPVERLLSERTVRLVHSYENSLWSQLVGQIDADEFWIISPFHDKTGETALKLAEHWPDAKMHFAVQSGYTNLNIQPLMSLKRVQLHEVRGESSRRIHAKLLGWKSQSGSGCLVGSANFTSAAMNSRNVETCLLVESPDDLLATLFDEDFQKEAIPFADFEPGSAEEPDSEVREAPPLQLASAILRNDSQIRVSYSHRLTEPPTSLRLAIRGMGDPIGGHAPISLKLPIREHAVETVSVREESLAALKGALVAKLIAETSSGQRESDAIWIVQPRRLTYEGSDGASSSRSQVQDSGEGLPEYLQEIGERDGIHGVIEFLKKLTIRFRDGGGNSVPRKFRVQIRDPFASDSIPNWLIEDKARSNDLAKAIRDFNKRHEKRRLRKHSASGNINGIENFLDIVRTMVRLTLVYSKYDEVSITRKDVIDVVTRCIELATSGVEDINDPWDGFLYSMWDSLDGDVPTLQAVLRENRYAAEIRAILLIAQFERFESGEKYLSKTQPQCPREVLPVWANIVRNVFSECEVEEPSRDDVADVLLSYNIDHFTKQRVSEMVDQL